MYALTPSAFSLVSLLGYWTFSGSMLLAWFEVSPWCCACPAVWLLVAISRLIKVFELIKSDIYSLSLVLLVINMLLAHLELWHILHALLRLLGLQLLLRLQGRCAVARGLLLQRGLLLHFEKHFLLRQVLLLRRTALGLDSLSLLDLLHQHDLLLTRKLLGRRSVALVVR